MYLSESFLEPLLKLACDSLSHSFGQTLADCYHLTPQVRQVMLVRHVCDAGHAFYAGHKGHAGHAGHKGHTCPAGHTCHGGHTGHICVLFLCK